MLTRFWFEYEKISAFDLPPGISIGCGVTAYSLEDALAIINDKVFYAVETPLVIKMVENIDIRQLDQGHVIPNMLNCNERGIWFPMGYR